MLKQYEGPSLISLIMISWCGVVPILAHMIYERNSACYAKDEAWWNSRGTTEVHQ